MTAGGQTGRAAAGQVGRWTSKRTVVTLGVLGAALAAISASQPWGTGTAVREIVGMRTVTGTGGQIAPLVPGLALVGGAAAVAAATTGRVARLVAAVAVLLAGLATLGVTAWTLTHLGAALGDRAASLAQSRSTIEMTADATPWPWLAALGGLVLVGDGLLALVAVRRWAAPSRRYERPGAAAPAQELSLWEQVGREDDALDGAPEEPRSDPRAAARSPHRDELDRRDTASAGDETPRT